MAISGKLVAGGIVGIGAIFGIGMWYAQTQSYYEPVEDLSAVSINGQSFTVTDYSGLDGRTSPLKLRGCFTIDQPQAAIAAGETATDAVPLTTPDWFGCFDPEAILSAIESGEAVAIMAGLDEGDGADLYMAIYPDGRAYQWRQPNEKYKGRH